MKIVKKSISKLVPAKYNPRTITDEARARLEASIEKFGLVQPIVWNRRSGNVVGGHQRLAVLQEKGVTEVRVVEVDLDEADEIQLNLAMNNPHSQGAFDFKKLESLNLDMAALDVPDMKALGLDEIFKEFGIGETKPPEPPEPPPVPKVAKSKRGELWRCGKHRVLCGDATSEEDMARLMDGKKAQFCFTSPPYAEQRKAQYGGIPEEEYVEWFDKVQARVKESLAVTASFFLNIKPNVKNIQRSLYVIDLVCAMVRRWDWLFVEEYCWLRGGVPGQVTNRFKNAFEPVYQFAMSDKIRWFPKEVRHKSGNVPVPLGPGWDTNIAKHQGEGADPLSQNEIIEGMAYPSNVLDFKNNARKLGHPAAFPIQLPTFLVRAYTAKADLILDPFLGSGTTLIAAEQLGRICFGMEIAPVYIDVILTRYAEFTGDDPVREDGKKWSEL